jgi:hypothetical protein
MRVFPRSNREREFTSPKHESLRKFLIDNSGSRSAFSQGTTIKLLRLAGEEIRKLSFGRHETTLFCNLVANRDGTDGADLQSAIHGMGDGFLPTTRR